MLDCFGHQVMDWQVSTKEVGKESVGIVLAMAYL